MLVDESKSEPTYQKPTSVGEPIAILTELFLQVVLLSIVFLLAFGGLVVNPVPHRAFVRPIGSISTRMLGLA